MADKKPIWIPTWLGLLILAAITWGIFRLYLGGGESSSAVPSLPQASTEVDAIADCARAGRGLLQGDRLLSDALQCS